ncbi:hypothetical protein OG455_27900 [Kitasatospora sp. NBC_01287]|uniref:hypothetical protein n=1 Tax=Kitasatospora sp. NBC_01287 TaxID=2903573 RepID=UPI00225C114B|nr:hypothetical protein [Kitasatospora sp. NBC_01287]MCX4749286.1 hypothetical protein [Kitasatospora sp. NBC_01287]
MTAHHTYTGPTTYRSAYGLFRGPHVTNAPIISVEPLDLSAYVRHSPAVRLILANNSGRGPKQLETAEWGTRETWQAAPTDAGPSNDIVAALTAAGIPAQLHRTSHGQAGAVLHLNRSGRYCQLVITMNTTLRWQLRDRRETAHIPWVNTRPADAPDHVRRLCHRINAHTLPTRPARALPGQPLNP